MWWWCGVEDLQLTAHRGELDEEARMSGTSDDMKGRAKEAAGDLTNDKDLKREGKTDQASGKIKDKVDDAKNWVTDRVDDVKDAANKK